MNLDIIINNILFSGANWSRREGEKLFKNGLVSDVKGKRVNDIYHIYGKTKDENVDRFYNSHIKIYTKDNKVVGVNCSCKSFLDSSTVDNNFRCKHIMAVAYRFNSLAKKNINKKSTQASVVNKKILSLSIRLKNIKEKFCDYYLVEFWVGDGPIYLINSVKEFVECFNFKKLLNISSKFTYDPRRHKLDNEGIKIMEYISFYLSSKISFDRINKEKVQGKNLILLEQYLRPFLENINNGTNVSLNYDYINYKSTIEKSNIPISFTLKLKDNNLLLITKNKLPIPLDLNKNVFIYERKVYLPEREQVNQYEPLYEKFIENGEVILRNTTESLKRIINKISRISNDITISEGVSRLIDKLITPEFYFYKENINIYCYVKMDSDIELKKLNLEEIKPGISMQLGLGERIAIELERIRFIKEDDKFVFIGEDDDIYNLLSFGLSELSKIGKVHLSREFEKIKLIKFDDLEYCIESDDGDFYLKYNIEDFSLNELHTVMNLMKNKKSFYKTKSNSYLDLRDNGVRTFLNILDSLSIKEVNDNKIKVEKNQLLFLEEINRYNGLKFNNRDETIKLISEKLQNREESKRVIPTDFKGTLRNYQITGYNWLKEISGLGLGAILADEMGLGKTIQVISFLLSEKGKKTLIVTPTSLIYNWKNEFLKFAPNLNIAVIHGNKKERLKYLDNAYDYDVLLTTYGTLKSDYEFYREREFKYCIIDEAQNIKNPKSQSSKYVKGVRSNCKIALTGTPIENNLIELWSIFDFIMPGYLLTEEKFKEKFINSKNDNFGELNDLIKPFILRRLKREVALELPDKIEKKYYVEMPLEQKQVYKSYIREVKNKIRNSDDRITVFSYLTKLRQICLHPSLLIEDYLGRSGKVTVAKDIIKDAISEDRKIIVFSQFTSVLKRFEKDLEKEDIKYLYLDGSTKAKERVELVNQFNNEKNISVFLISLKAGGTGLNLTSADLVIHFDPWWNPATEDQATDRAHRIGQRNIVEVIKLVSKDTIEEKIIEMQDDKRELINKVITGDSLNTNLISILTNQEILDLFN